MKFKITAVNTKNPSEKFEYELEGESVDSFKYFDEAEGKFFHPKEVLNNKMREMPIITPCCHVNVLNPMLFHKFTIVLVKGMQTLP